MKLRALGTGGPFSRWPLIPSCWLIHTDKSYVLVGCPPQVGARLATVGVPLEKIDMIVLLGASVAQAGGLDEFGHYFQEVASNCEGKPYLACPEALMSKVLGRLEYPHGLSPKVVKKISFTEEHVSETLTFVDNFSGGYGFRLEEAKVFCSGRAKVNEEWLHQNMDCDLILHEDRPELAELPIYLQERIWIYGYPKQPDGTDPIPMLYVPQNSFVYDSDRRDKILTKERFIRENSKRVVGNEGAV